MKKWNFTFLLLCTILFQFSLGQKEDYIWRIGRDGGINFNHYPPDTFSIGKFSWIQETNSSICDSAGNILFYTNGAKIFNRNDDVMLNGDGLNPSSYTSSLLGEGLPISGADIIIQRPNHPTQYYLFHGTYDNDAVPIFPFRYCNVLYQTVIDMTLDNGRGGVTSIKNHHIWDNDTLLPNNLAVVRHANGRDWWLISKKLLDPVFYKWLITPDSIIGPFVQNNTLASGYAGDEGFGGQACFSPQGDKYAVMYFSGHFYLYDFDRCTGQLKYVYNKQMSDSSVQEGFGCAFSISGRYLYANTQWKIHQFDLWSGNIASSEKIVSIYDGFTCQVQIPPYLMRLAPDNKIYLSTGNGTGGTCNFISVIEYPDSDGLSCNIKQHSFLMPSTNSFSFPNLPDYKLGALEGSPCDTILSGIQNVELRIKEKITVYPNPIVSEEITLSYHILTMPANLSIYNIDGKEVARYNLPQWSREQKLRLPKLASGIYFITLQAGDKRMTGKFVKE